MYRIEKPELLWLLLLIPLVWGIFIFLRLQKRNNRNKLIDKNIQSKIIRFDSIFKPYLRLFLWSVSLFFLIVAMANPQMGSKLEKVQRRGADIVFAIDVSKSMMAEDVKPNRLLVAKQIVGRTIDRLVSDRVGIIAYAGEAVPAVPITSDYAAAKMYLQQLNTDFLSSQGTAIGQAIRLAESYYDRDDADKILVILSDGEDHGEQAREAAREAAAKGIKIITVGIGTDTGAPIPLRRDGQLYGYKTDARGNRVITKRNQTLLYALAKASGGTYIDGNNSYEAVKKLMQLFKNLNRKTFETTRISEYKSQYQWFLGVALLFFLLYLITNERETLWLRKLNLFNENNEENEV